MSLNVYILTFNCARAPVQPEIFAPYLFEALASDPTPQLNNDVAINDTNAVAERNSQAEGSSMGASELPHLLALNLQELAPIAYSFLGGSFLEPYFDAFREVVRMAAEAHPSASSSFSGRQSETHRHTYVNVVSRNLGMTGVMLFARDDVVDNISWVRSGGVGVGVAEMGNKGAVGVRIGYRFGQLPHEEGGDEAEEAQFTFIAAHLAPMEDGLEQRNRDYLNIVRRLVFVPDPISSSLSKKRKTSSSGNQQADEEVPLLRATDLPSSSSSRPPSSGSEPKAESGIYSSSSSTNPTDHLFFAGDLNYRTSLLRPSPLDVQEKFPLRKAQHDADDPRNFRHLLAHDQLAHEVEAGRALHGLTEAPIAFPPTYKYRHPDPKRAVVLDADGEWAWARHRWPSWCDRIFFWKDEDEDDNDNDNDNGLPLNSAETETESQTAAQRKAGDVKGDVTMQMQTQSRVNPHRYTCLPLFATSDHRPVALSASVPLPGLGLQQQEQQGGKKKTKKAHETRVKHGKATTAGQAQEQGDSGIERRTRAPTGSRAPPCGIDPTWRSRRARARNNEIVVGVMAYLALTREGNALLVATTIGAVGGWLIIRSLLLTA